MFARENERDEPANIAILLRNDVAFSPFRPRARTRLPRAMLEIEINSSLPGVHVRVARRWINTSPSLSPRERKITILLTRERDYCWPDFTSRDVIRTDPRRGHGSFVRSRNSLCGIVVYWPPFDPWTLVLRILFRLVDDFTISESYGSSRYIKLYHSIVMR